MAASDDGSAPSDMSDYDDDEEYEELEKDDYCAERIRRKTEAVFLKKMVDSELKEMLQFAWDEEFQDVARMFINREPRNGPVYEKKYTVIRCEEAPFFFRLTIKTDNGEAKFLVPSLEVVILRLIENGTHWSDLSANDCANAAIRSVHFELWPLCPVGILSRLVFFSAWLVFDRKAILRYAEVPIVRECLTSQFIRNLRTPGAIMPREWVKQVAGYYSFMQRFADAHWDKFAGKDFDEFHRHFNAIGHGKPQPKGSSWRKKGAWLKWVPTASPTMRDYYDEVKNGIDAVVPAARRFVYWRDKDAVANDVRDVEEKLDEFRESFKARNERENRLTERSRAAKNMLDYTAKQASALRKDKEYQKQTIREKATMRMTRKMEETRIRMNRTAAAPHATVSDATVGAHVLHNLSPLAPSTAQNRARTARVAFNDDFVAAEYPASPGAAPRTPPPGPSNIDLHDRIASLEAEVASKDEQLRDKAACIASKDDKLRTKEAFIDELLKKLSDWQSQWQLEKAALVAEKDATMEQEKASLEAKCASLEADLRQTSDENARLKEDLETLREELEYRNDDVKALKEQQAQNVIDLYEERRAMKTDFEQRDVKDSMEQMLKELEWQEKESALKAEMERMQADVRDKAVQLEHEKAELANDHLLAIARMTQQYELLLAKNQALNAHLAARKDQTSTLQTTKDKLRETEARVRELDSQLNAQNHYADIVSKESAASARREAHIQQKADAAREFRTADLQALEPTMGSTPSTPRATRAGPLVHALSGASSKKRHAPDPIAHFTPLANRMNGTGGVSSPRAGGPRGPKRLFASTADKENTAGPSEAEVLQVASKPLAPTNRQNDAAKNTPKPPFRL